MDEITTKVRPIFTELQGYLSSAPVLEKVTYLYDETLWTQFNNLIDELNSVTNKDYNKFKIIQITQSGTQSQGLYILNSDYRSKLNGLIMRLYGEYFSEQVAPFSGNPGMVINQSQQQQQSTIIQMIMDFQSYIDKKLYDPNITKDDKTFLEKIKSSLPNVKSVAEIVNLILTIGKTLNIPLDQISKILG